jgi:hypothetical protein
MDRVRYVGAGSRMKRCSCFWRTFQPYGQIGAMRIDASEFHLLTDNATEEGAPAWVPSKTQE